MCLYLLTILTSQSDISKLAILPQICKSSIEIFLEVVPVKTQLLRHRQASTCYQLEHLLPFYLLELFELC